MGFYRVVRVPLDRPLDTDGDGIDDVYELRRGSFLDPLDPLDAGQDFDGDGASNLEEFQRGTDPEVADSALAVAIQQSGHDATYVAPASVVIQASASAKVVLVEFFINGIPEGKPGTLARTAG